MFSSWAQLFRRRKKLILYFICSKAESARGKKFTSDLTVLLIVADKNWQKGKVIRASGIQFTSFNPLSKYFIFRNTSTAISKIERLCGTLRRIKFFEPFIPTSLPPSKSPSAISSFWIYLPDYPFSLYSLETNKKNLNCWH